MKHIIKVLSLALSSLLIMSCSEEDVKRYTTVQRPAWSVVNEDYLAAAPSNWTMVQLPEVQKPQWNIELKGDDATPEWSFSQANEYPVSMTMVIRLSSLLESRVNSNDKMCAFIGDECRGTATVVMNGDIPLFYLMVKGDDAETREVKLNYYSANDTRIYSASSGVNFQVNKLWGTPASPESPDFEKSGKYPLLRQCYFNVNRKVGSSDVMSVFVGDECRGIISPSAKGPQYIEARAKNESEKFTIKYYDSINKRLLRSKESFSFDDLANFKDEESSPELSFIPENTLEAFVSLPKELQDFVSDKDCLALFCNDKCVGTVTSVDKSNQSFIYKMLVNCSPEYSDNFVFKYYCDKLNYLFCTSDVNDILSEETFGSLQNPKVLDISLKDKHPLNMNITFEIPSDILLKASSNDLMAAFVGEECRGIGKYIEYDGTKLFDIKVSGSLSNNESITLYYYCAKNMYLYTGSSQIPFVGDSNLGNKENPYSQKLIISE